MTTGLLVPPPPPHPETCRHICCHQTQLPDSKNKDAAPPAAPGQGAIRRDGLLSLAQASRLKRRWMDQREMSLKNVPRGSFPLSSYPSLRPHVCEDRTTDGSVMGVLRQRGQREMRSQKTRLPAWGPWASTARRAGQTSSQLFLFFF